MNQPDNNPDAVKLLSDDEVAEIERVIQTSPCATFPMTTEEARALCATVRALRESLRAAVASIKVNDQGQPLERACPWTLDWYAVASAMLNGQSFDPQPQYEKGFEAGTAFAKSAIEDLQSQLAQVTQEWDYWRTQAGNATAAAEKWYRERY